VNTHAVSWFAGLAVLPCAAIAVQAPRTPVEAPALSALAAPVRLECDTGPIDSGPYIAHSGPMFADLDGDKKPELLVGNFKGHFQLYANAGEPNAPKLVAKGLLQAEGKDAFVKNW
jgi:hypothetical protein